MTPSAPSTLNVVFVGFGNVARTFVDLLSDRQDRLQALRVPAIRVVGIATKRHGCALAPAGLDAARAAALVAAGSAVDPLHTLDVPPPADGLDLIRQLPALELQGPLVVIETTVLNVRDGEPATSHVRTALAAGAHVITANKGPIACHWRPLRDEAARANRLLLFEGVVMDGIPIFNLVRQTLPALDVTGVRGIVNTTTNYLLAALEEGRALGEALPEMQARGIAEADASLDVDGWDAAAKAAALANVLLDADLTPADVRRTGVGTLTPTDAKRAIDAGYRLKLVMEVRRVGTAVEASVGPQRVPAGDLLASVNGVMNALTISTDRLGDITVVQHGGSLVETAYGLISDLVSLQRALR